MTADTFVRRATEAGRKAHDIASDLLEQCGFEVVRSPATVRGSGVKFSFLVADRSNGEWWIDVAGAFTTVRPGLLRAETLWKALGRASVLAAAEAQCSAAAADTPSAPAGCRRRPCPAHAGASSNLRCNRAVRR